MTTFILPSRWIANTLLLICGGVLLTGASAQNLPKSPNYQYVASGDERVLDTCSPADIAKYGRPVMYPFQRGLSFGLSAPKPQVKMGEPLVVYVWLSNQSSTDFYYGLCCEDTFLDWIEVFNANHQRLVSFREQATNGRDVIRACTCSEEIHPRHSGFCGVIDNGTLNRAYDLSPGAYTVVGVRHGPGTTTPESPITIDGLKISITPAQ
jgi:hypothetical protein